jgi:hypothetical protein
MNLNRTRRLAERAITACELDLRGLVVLTEAATGDFALTAPLAALSGADRVLALGHDSRFGSADQARQACYSAATAWGVADNLEFLNDREDPRISSAHVVTNLGALRPLDRTMLARLGPHAALPLMWETWEFRPEDLDLEECRRLGIPVLGTDEGRLGTFAHVGVSAVKLLFEAGVEVLGSRVAVVGRGGFCSAILTTLRALGAEALPVSDDRLNLPAGLDAVVVAEHHRRDTVLGPAAIESLARNSSGAPIAHICGAVDWKAAATLGVDHVPSTPAPAGYMSITANYAGPRALVDLHSAGLKVGAELARARMRGLNGLKAELEVLARCPLAQGFADRHHSSISLEERTC